MNKKLLGISALLLVLVILTTCVVGGTFAKYTQKVSGTDEARVAKFAYTVSQTEEGVQALTTAAGTEGDPIPVIDIFGTSQDDTGIVNADDTNTQKLVAPGMEGFFRLSFTNASEVAVQVTIDGLNYVNANYLPIIYFFNGRYYSDIYGKLAYGTVSADDFTFYRHQGDTAGITLDGNMADLTNALNTYFDMAATAEPGGVRRLASAFFDAGSTDTKNIDIYWFWAYETKETDNHDDSPYLRSVATLPDGTQYRVYEFPWDTAYDTIRGLNGTYTVSMTPVIRVTQIDTYNTAIATATPGTQAWANLANYGPVYQTAD